MECLCLVWELEKLHYYIDASVLEVIKYCNAVRSLLNMKTLNRNMLRCRWALDNTPDNPAYGPLEAAPQIAMEGIKITDIGTEFFAEVRESYKQDKNFHIMSSLLDKDCKETSLVNALDEV
ncbi:hypothetical protein O181_091583 [Austropuccinia psidii MF-1]|uniref:Uncharacterized protein n=1 Tax=Austropuccinia psidii MF-1 TaxID=1389203 RepID=A0A9Q3P7N1_9BASI|nr:hypothetical protein [Austropuccinia psidii MF-1]